jgi:hypothetical protein
MTMIKTAPIEMPLTRRLIPIRQSLEVHERGRRKAFARDDKTDTKINLFVIDHVAGFISILQMCQWTDVIRERFS